MQESINFTKCYALRKISDLNIEGSFNNSWSGKYHRVSRNKVTIFEPIIGSGLVVRTTELNNGKLLDDELSKIISRSGIIYTIVSNKFPILYTGITTGDLQTGVFGAGRLKHHVRKLLAALNTSTNHTQGWHGHAHERYKFLIENLNENDLCSALDDIFVSFAHVEDPDQYEGTAFDAFKTQLLKHAKEITVLNHKTMKRIPSVVNLPSNLEDSIGFASWSEYLNPTKPKFIDENYENSVQFDNLGDFERFKKLLAWARSGSGLTVVEKKVRGYTNQPSGLNGIPMVVFAELGSSGRALPNKWICRIPLKLKKSKKIAITLPIRLLNKNIDQQKIEIGKDANFKPIDIDEFIEAPTTYVTL
jgi:hypothetical protein